MLIEPYRPKLTVAKSTAEKIADILGGAAILFSILQEAIQSPQPVHLSKSITIAHFGITFLLN